MQTIQNNGLSKCSERYESDEYFTDINSVYIKNRTCLRIRNVNNEYLVETAGFVPLSVRFKQFTENGIVSRLRAEQYDTDLPVSELENAFQMSEFDINDDDDIFTATEKINARKNYIAELKKSYSDLSAKTEAEKVGNNSTSTEANNVKEPVIEDVAGDK